MTTEGQSQSSEIPQINGIEDDATPEPDNDSTSNTPSASVGRRSRFFRTKRKQRVNEEPANQANGPTDEPNEQVTPSEDSEQRTEETSAEVISTFNADTKISPAVTRRPLSPPPPPPPSSDDIDEPDDSSTSEPPEFTMSTADTDVECQTYPTKNDTPDKTLSAQSRTSLPTIFASYKRKKSQSVKLTRIDSTDAYPKKNVRFADDFGLDLSQVRVIKSDELPHVPSAAFKDLHISDDNSTNIYQERMKTITYLEQRFENPIHSHGFEDRVARHKVVLEQANAIDNRIYGTIKIISFGLNKRVKVRLTTDNWMTSQDYDTVYVTDSFDGTHDRFSFTVDIDRDRICIGNTIQFCIGYESYVGPEYWDNNYQQNYRFECISRSIPDYSG